jgi:flagella basal body P-ring formation protein FlgA
MTKVGWTGLGIILTLWLTSIVLAEAAGAITIEIPETISVTGPKIFLSDLGVVRGGTTQDLEYLKQVDLGQAPFPGQVRIFTKEYLTLITQQHRFNQTFIINMGKQVEVRVRATCIKGAAIQKAIEEQLPPKRPNVLKKWIDLHNVPGEIWLSTGEWQIQATPNGNIPELGTVLFKIVLSNGKEKRVINISGKIGETALVHRSVKTIALHADLKQDDFETVEMELVNGKEFLGEIPGQYRTTKPIKQGDILREDQVQPIPLVQKDREVNVVVKGNSIEIMMVGIAKLDGWMGDEIIIQNPTSRKTFRGRVIGLNKVEVKFE